MIVRFFGIATWRTNLDTVVVEALHHWQIIADTLESSWASLFSGLPSLSGNLLFGTANIWMPPEGIEVLWHQPGLQQETRAKPQWHSSHLQTHLAQVQSHKHKIKLCFFWISSQLQWLALPDHLSLCHAFYPWMGTKRGFIYLCISLYIFLYISFTLSVSWEHKDWVAFVTQADRKHMDIGIPCCRQTCCWQDWRKIYGLLWFLILSACGI